MDEQRDRKSCLLPDAPSAAPIRLEKVLLVQCQVRCGIKQHGYTPGRTVSRRQSRARAIEVRRRYPSIAQIDKQGGVLRLAMHHRCLLRSISSLDLLPFIGGLSVLLMDRRSHAMLIDTHVELNFQDGKKLGGAIALSPL